MVVDDYGKMIEIISSKYDKYIRDDIKQELLMLVNDIIHNKNERILNLNSYIFKTLKNKAMQINIKYTESKRNCISLNSEIKGTDKTLIDVLACNEQSNGDYQIQKYKSILYKVIDDNLNLKERRVIKLYYIKNIHQKDIAEKMNVSPQYISKLIKNALTKLKEAFDCIEV